MASLYGQNHYITTLADASQKTSYSKVNLMALVVHIGLIRRSQGTDLFQTLKIVDHTHGHPGVTLTIFRAKKTEFPKVSCGDIISVQNAEVQFRNEDFFVVLRKIHCYFALFQGKNASDRTPFQSSSLYCLTAYDVAALDQLRSWLIGYIHNTGTLLKHITPSRHYDIICKVCYVSDEIRTNECLLFAWDGTDCPPQSLDMSLDTEVDNPSPVHPEVFSVPGQVLLSFPHVGTILMITCSKFIREIKYLKGQAYWARISNLSCKLENGMWKGTLHGQNGRIQILSKVDAGVKDRRRLYGERITSGLRCEPWYSISQSLKVTEVDAQRRGVACTTLMGSLTHEEISHEVKCVVRVVAACPWRAEDVHTLGVRLIIEDPTARVRAYLLKEDVETFFGGYQTTGALDRKIKKILGIRDNSKSRDPPWFECCLLSCSVDESGTLESRRYRIVNTVVRAC